MGTLLAKLKPINKLNLYLGLPPTKRAKPIRSSVILRVPLTKMPLASRQAENSLPQAQARRKRTVTTEKFMATSEAYVASTNGLSFAALSWLAMWLNGLMVSSPHVQ